MSAVEPISLVRERLPAWPYVSGLVQRARSSSAVVVLLGSYARGVADPELSDVDLLVVEGQLDVPRPPPIVQVTSLSHAELHRRIADGDDFVQWCLRFGRPLVGGRAWAAMRRELLPTAPWPDPMAHTRRGIRAARSARRLYAVNDRSGAWLEVRAALHQLARARLLARGVFPLSRPELPEQLRRAGETWLASELERSTKRGSMPWNRLERVLHVLDEQFSVRA